MSARRLAWLFLPLCTACVARTSISPVPPKPAVAEGGGPAAECAVQRFETANDVPSGAKSLGEVRIPKAQSEEATLELLRKKICELGGEAFSQLRWEHPQSADAPPSLTANAWSLP